MYSRRGACSAALLVSLLLVSMSGSSGRTMFQVEPAADSSAAAAPAGESPVSTNMTSLMAKQIMEALKALPRNMTLPKLRPLNFTLPENYTLPSLKNITLENGMTALEFAKALMTGTISSNTADTNTPDKGLSDVQSGALNINPFMDGAAMSNALTLAGRDSTANSRGIVFGLVGTGRSSSQATALGVTGAKSSTDTFVINGGGLNQNAMSSNLAVAPQGPSDTSVRSAAFNIIGGITTGGLTTAIGKKGADSAALGAGMTALGDSYSSQSANSFAEGDTSSNTGVIAGTLTGASKGTVGSLAVSAKKSADTRALATAKSAIGSSTSKSSSISSAAQNATSVVGSNSFSGVGNSASISSTTATGTNAVSEANSEAESQAGAANAVSVAKSVGVTSASASSNSTSKPSVTGTRRNPVLAMQLRLPSATFSSSSSSSNSLGKNNKLPSLLLQLPKLPTLPTTAPLLGEALISNIGLKALLPSVPKITPQLPTLNQTVEVEAAPPCNETEMNLNRTSDQPWLSCNSTGNGTTPVTPPADPMTSLPGLKFFDNMKAMNEKFLQENTRASPSPSPEPPKPPTPAKKSTTSSSGGSTVKLNNSSVKPKSSPKPSPKPGSTAIKASSIKPKSSPKPSPKPQATGRRLHLADSPSNEP